MSTKAALEHLGLGPCYHFVTQFERPQDIDVWQAAAEGKPVDWTALFADFQSIVDWPASLFYKQLMAMHPEAKVLLNVRDPEAWYESMLKTVYLASQAGWQAEGLELQTEVLHGEAPAPFPIQCARAGTSPGPSKQERCR